MMKFDVVEIAAIDAVEIAVEPWIWPFAQTRRADIPPFRGPTARTVRFVERARVAAASLCARESRFARGELRD